MRPLVLLGALVALAPSRALALAPEEEKQVMEGLSSPSFKVRMQAAITLGSSGDPAAAAPLARLLSDPEPTVRGAAALALGKLGAPAAVEPLAMAAEDPDDFVRAHIRHALLLLGTSDRFDRYWNAAQTAGTHGRRAMAEAVCRMTSDAARVALLPLSADPDPGVRDLATQTLVALPPGERAALLARGLQNPIGRVRSRAAALVGRLHIVDLVPALAALAARGDELDEVRRMAKRALWELRAEVDPAPSLEILASAASAEERARAAVLIGVCGGERAVGALSSALDDPDARLRFAAAQALADRATAAAASAIRAAAARETDFGTRIRLEQLARDAGQSPAWQAIALGN